MTVRGAVLIILAVLFAAWPATTSAQTAPAAPIIIGQSYRLPSAIMGEAREINVWLPPGYGETDQTYPVLVVLDGGVGQDFHHISGLAQLGTVNGTTRDVIEVRMDLEGLPVTLLDTAGLRTSEDIVEEIGIGRALARAAAADLRVFLPDGDAAMPGIAPMPDDIIVLAKADIRVGSGLRVSSKTGEGLTDLVAAIAERLVHRSGLAGTVTRERHRIAIVTAIGAMESARVELTGGSDRVELVAEDLHQAIGALDSLIGRVDVESLLDEIFASFCIGK